MTIGLLGFGRIAQLVAFKLQSFGAQIIAFDKYTNSEVFTKLNVTPVSLEELLTQSDLLSLHVPITPETENMINHQTLQQMPKGSFLVNTCRGGVVNEEDLASAISSGHIGGAGLDVLKKEPPGLNHPLVGLREVLITPHASYISENSVDTLKQRTCELIVSGILHKPLINVVNQKKITS